MRYPWLLFCFLEVRKIRKNLYLEGDFMKIEFDMSVSVEETIKGIVLSSVKQTAFSRTT